MDLRMHVRKDLIFHRWWTTTTAHFDKWFSVSDYSFDARMIKSLTLVLRRVLLCSSSHRRRQNNGATAQAARPAHVARRSSSSTTRATNTTRTTRAQLRQPHVWRDALTLARMSTRSTFPHHVHIIDVGPMTVRPIRPEDKSTRRRRLIRVISSQILTRQLPMAMPTTEFYQFGPWYSSTRYKKKDNLHSWFAQWAIAMNNKKYHITNQFISQYQYLK